MMHDMFHCHESLQNIWMQALHGSEVVKTVASIVDLSRGKQVGEHLFHSKQVKSPVSFSQ